MGLFPWLRDRATPKLPAAPNQTPAGPLGVPNVNTTTINTPYKDRLQDTFNLPAAPNHNAVVSETEAAARAEATNLLLRKFSQQRLRRANAIASQYQTAASHLKGMQRIQNRVEKTDADIIKALMGHRLESAQNKAEVTGYDAAYQQRLGSIDL